MAASRSLRILYVSPFYDDRIADPVASLDHFPILRELPHEMHARGHQVRVLGLGSTDAWHQAGGVRYWWHAPAVPVRLLGGLAHRWKPHYGPAYYSPSLTLARHVRALDPDIIHVLGLTMAPQLALINLAVRQRSRIAVHYHGGTPPSGRFRTRLQRLALREIGAALFTSIEQANPWIGAGLLHREHVWQILETSSPFTGIPREEARLITGMTGNPVYLSAGRLHQIKDPLTMLRGFEMIARQQPDARLYLYYLTSELLDDARAHVRASPLLRDRIEFRGRATPDQMEAIYSSADVLLQASRREWSGLAVLEAMSCGCIPVVSDIPSFAAMTGNGAYGRLFEAGHPGALAQAALAIDDLGATAADVRGYFERELSFAAMAHKLEQIYDRLLASR